MESSSSSSASASSSQSRELHEEERCTEDDLDGDDPNEEHDGDHELEGESEDEDGSDHDEHDSKSSDDGNDDMNDAPPSSRPVATMEDNIPSTDLTSSEEFAGTTKAKEKKKVHQLSLSKTEDFNAKLKKRGVLYVARVPPRMTPTKLKSLLSVYGEVTRVYLVEEDASVRKRRRKLSGNGSKRYVEGWVEFANKKVAKHVATSLNTTPISKYKRDPHYGDLWALKYLHKFQWSHLTEKVAYERRVREQKLRLETMQARRETVAYKKLVETGLKLDKIAERKRRRAEKNGGASNEVSGDTNKNHPIAEKPKHRRPPQVRHIDGDADHATKKSILGALV